MSLNPCKTSIPATVVIWLRDAPAGGRDGAKRLLAYISLCSEDKKKVGSREEKKVAGIRETQDVGELAGLPSTSGCAWMGQKSQTTLLSFLSSVF